MKAAIIYKNWSLSDAWLILSGLSNSSKFALPYGYFLYYKNATIFAL